MRGLAIAALVAAGVFIALRIMNNIPMPKVHLVTLAGQTTDLPALAAGKPAVVNLWATWCPPCREEMPHLAAAQRREAGIHFVFVDQGEDVATIERYLNAARLELANVMLDPSSKLGREIGSNVLPVTLFYDAGGRLVDSSQGALTPASLSDKLARLK